MTDGHVRAVEPGDDREVVVLGIDAGGTGTRARAVVGDQIVFEGTGGPGNPKAVTADVLAASFDQALAGCPAPRRVGACIAGAGDERTQIRMTDMLSDYFPGATIRVAPDYVAAFQAAPQGIDVCVIAGTGSLVCSNHDGNYAVSGGNGWIIGDHGSAARLGRAALDWIIDNWATLPIRVGRQVSEIFGARDRQMIVRSLNGSPSPASFLARAAVILTAEAERGEAWAAELLRTEMSALARTTAQHIARHVANVNPVNIALAGGVWESRMAAAVYVEALDAISPATVHSVIAPEAPIVGAIRFAASIG